MPVPARPRKLDETSAATSAEKAYPHHTANLSSIARLFAFWKLLLLLVVAAAPGPGYDTSTDLLLHDPRLVLAPLDPGSPSEFQLLSVVRRALAHVLPRLTRWDAVYFLDIARRGYRFEQEWAFGWGFTSTVSLGAKAVPESLLPSPLLRQAFAGVLLSHLAHLLSCFVLYALTLRLLPDGFREHDRRAAARLAACLHVLSPAGVFLSATSPEALFSFSNFLGFLLLSTAGADPPTKRHTIVKGLYAVGAGLIFAAASTIRGNGLLSAAAFAVHALPMALRLLCGTIAGGDVFVLACLVLGAGATVLGFAYPQYLAYTRYCTIDAALARPWCEKIPPSIFTFVQAHYWGNGFLKYWTLSNAPLFAIAIPVLLLLATTSVPPLRTFLSALWSRSTPDHAATSTAAIAVSQLTLAVLALTSFHVQIANRIASGYPLWYVVLATGMRGPTRSVSDGSSKATITMPMSRFLLRPTVQRRIVKGMMLYGVIQAGLYASFLPPA